MRAGHRQLQVGGRQQEWSVWCAHEPSARRKIRWGSRARRGRVQKWTRLRPSPRPQAGPPPPPIPHAPCPPPPLCSPPLHVPSHAQPRNSSGQHSSQSRQARLSHQARCWWARFLSWLGNGAGRGWGPTGHRAVPAGAEAGVHPQLVAPRDGRGGVGRSVGAAARGAAARGAEQHSHPINDWFPSAHDTSAPIIHPALNPHCTAPPGHPPSGCPPAWGAGGRRGGEGAAPEHPPPPRAPLSPQVDGQPPH